MTGLCDKCKELKLEQGDDENSVTYFQWQSINGEKTIKGEKKIFKTTKEIPITTTIKDFTKTLAEEIPTMKQHVYGIYNYNKRKKRAKTEND